MKKAVDSQPFNDEEMKVFVLYLIMSFPPLCQYIQNMFSSHPFFLSICTFNKNTKTSTKTLVENSIRAEWETGAACQIYSNSKKQWLSGEVAAIFTDEEGEWMRVRYDKSKSKQVQRFSSDIRPHVCVFSAKSHTIHQKHNIHSQTTPNCP